MGPAEAVGMAEAARMMEAAEAAEAAMVAMEAVEMAVAAMVTTARMCENASHMWPRGCSKKLVLLLQSGHGTAPQADCKTAATVGAGAAARMVQVAAEVVGWVASTVAAVTVLASRVGRVRQVIATRTDH